MTAMSALLACWASTGHSIANCAAAEVRLRGCMDEHVSIFFFLISLFASSGEGKAAASGRPRQDAESERVFGSWKKRSSVRESGGGMVSCVEGQTSKMRLPSYD